MIAFPLLDRLVRGSSWTWVAESRRGCLPGDLDANVLDWEGRDRFHAKQGRSTARFRVDGPNGSVSVYLKRHDRLPWTDRLGAWLHPGRGHSPASAEWAHLKSVRDLGIAVPEAVAAGERIGPWGRLRSYLMIAELVGSEELNVLVPKLAERLDSRTFAATKRRLVREMARIAATLHNARLFHKDLYLCHFFLDATDLDCLTLIDLHRLGRHRWLVGRWRRKDLGQLLYSTRGVPGIDDRDRQRFWMHYRRACNLGRRESAAIVAKADRYEAHNRSGG